jgi:hypothetical protein
MAVPMNFVSLRVRLEKTNKQNNQKEHGVRMDREGFRREDLHSSPSGHYRGNAFLEREEELLTTIELLSAKLKVLEEKESNRVVDKDSSGDSAANSVDCSFASTCYGAKNKMGPCPCELQR